MSTLVHHKWCSIVFRMRIAYMADSEATAASLPTQVSKWTAAMDTFWNAGGWTDFGCGGVEWMHGCCRVSFQFESKIVTDEWPVGWHRIKIAASLPGGAWVEDGDVAQSVGGEWAIDEPLPVVVHEVGHLLGLADEADTAHGGHDENWCLCIMAYAGSYMTLVHKSHLEDLLSPPTPWCSIMCCLWPWRWPRLIPEFLRWLRKPPPPVELPPRYPPLDPELPWRELFAHEAMADPAGFARVSGILAQRKDVSPDALIDEMANPDVARRALAAILLGSGRVAEGADVLRQALGDDDLSVRIHAARSLARLGISDGVPVLLDALSEDSLILRHPPEPAGAYAYRVLRHHWEADVAFDAHADASAREEGVRRWRAWWSENEGVSPRR